VFYYQFGSIGSALTNLTVMKRRDTNCHDASTKHGKSLGTAIDDLSAQSRATGILLVVFALIMALSMLAKHRPESVTWVSVGVLGVVADWRTWAVLAAATSAVAAWLIRRR
jgi:hypothetical protein